MNEAIKKKLEDHEYQRNIKHKVKDQDFSNFLPEQMRKLERNYKKQ